MSKEIRLTQNRVAIVDDIDYERVFLKGKWSYKVDKYGHEIVCYCRSNSTTRLSRFILNVDNSVIVKYRNGNCLDNTRKNLIIVPISEKTKEINLCKKKHN